MTALLLLVGIPFVLALGTGWTILRLGGGLYSGSGYGAKGFVAVLLAICAFTAVAQFAATNRPHPGEMYGGLINFFVFIIASGSAGGFFVILLTTLRPPPRGPDNH